MGRLVLDLDRAWLLRRRRCSLAEGEKNQHRPNASNDNSDQPKNNPIAVHHTLRILTWAAVV